MKASSIGSTLNRLAGSEEDYLNPGDYWERRLGRRFDSTGAGYGSLGPKFNEALYAARLRSMEMAFSACGITLAGRSVLDVGCGTGFYSEVCRRASVASYIGVDLTAVSVTRLSARYPGFRFVQADVGSQGFSVGGPFDLIIAADILFHIIRDEHLEIAIRNLSRCLVPSGRLVLSDVLSLDTVQPAPHCRFRALDTYERLLGAYGMHIERVEPIFAALQPPVHVRGTSRGWQGYALAWRVGGMRLARHKWFDQWVPRGLAWLDRTVLLPRAGVWTPNSKWLIAMKPDAL